MGNPETGERCHIAGLEDGRTSKSQGRWGPSEAGKQKETHSPLEPPGGGAGQGGLPTLAPGGSCQTSDPLNCEATVLFQATGSVVVVGGRRKRLQQVGLVAAGMVPWEMMVH